LVFCRSIQYITDEAGNSVWRHIGMRKNTPVAIDGCCHIAILLLSDYINGTLTIFFDFILFYLALCLDS